MRGRGPRMRKRLPMAPILGVAAADDVETGTGFRGPGPSLAWLQGFNVEEALASTNGGPQYQMLDDGDSTNTCAAASCFYSPNNGDPAPWTPYDVWWLRPSSDGRSMWLPQRLRWASGSFARAAAELAEHIMRRRQVRLTPAPPRRLHPRRQVPQARPTNCPQASDHRLTAVRGSREPPRFSISPRRRVLTRCSPADRSSTSAATGAADTTRKETSGLMEAGKRTQTTHRATSSTGLRSPSSSSLYPGAPG